MRARGTFGLLMTRTSGVFALALALAATNGASAQAGIRVLEIERVRVDGAIGEWRGARLTSVGEGADASMRFALAYDARGLYVAAEVWDDRLVRTASPGATEDAVILTLAGAGRGARAVDIYLYAGESGRSAASAGSAPFGTARVRPLAGAQVVEGPLARGRGYTIEAFIPFSAVPGGARGWERARASIRLRDVDREARPEVESEPGLVAATTVDALLPLMPAGGASGALEEFLNSQSLLASRPTHDLRGDVAGDAREERVYLVAGFLLVTGPGFRDGNGYAYHRLPVDEARDVRAAELTDVTGDGKDELLVVLRQRNAQGERDLWQVMSLTGESPRALFGIEVRKAIGQGSIEARLRVRPERRGAATIEVRTGRAAGLDAETYREAAASDAEPILLPWGPVLERTYRWNGRTFERVGERPNPRYTPPSEAPARAATPAPAVEEAPAPPSEDALLAAFRRQRGIAARARPRFRARVNLAGGPEPESALVFGRQLVVVGPGVQDGASWLFYEIPAPSDADLLAMETADVTGDGRAEILLRVRQTFGEVVREVLLVHQLTGNGFPRLLQVEIARTQGEDSIRNEVRTAGGALEIRPGRASGWSESRWPFTRDPSDAVEPLLLPWRDRAVRYQLRGGRLQAR